MKRIPVILILSLLTFDVGSVTGNSASQGNNCQNLASKITSLKADVADLQAQLQEAPPNQKAGLAAQIKSIKAQITNLQSQLEACQAIVCPLTPPATANLLQLTGTGRLISASPHSGQQYSFELQLKNPTTAPVTIKRAESFHAEMGGWVSLTEGDMFAKDATFSGVNPVLPAGAVIGVVRNVSWSSPIAYVIIVIEAESNRSEQELITSISINNPTSVAIPSLSAQRRVFIGVQGPVQVLKLTNGKNWLSIIGQVINGTGKAATVKDWKLSLRDPQGNLVVTTSDKRFFDAEGTLAPFNSTASLNKFLYGYDLPSTFTNGTLRIDANVLMEGICQHITYEADVKAALYKTIGSPVVGQWQWGNGPGVLGFHSHTNSTIDRYTYDLVKTKTVDGMQQTYKGDPAKNESYYCWDQPIYCVEDGWVVAVDDKIEDNSGNQGVKKNPANPDWKNSYVIVGHDGVFPNFKRYSEYVHVRKGSAMVAQGQKVKAGTLLAKVGNAGQTSWPHLHFGYYVVDRGRLRGLPVQFNNLLNLDFSKAVGVPVNEGVFLFTTKLF